MNHQGEVEKARPPGWGAPTAEVISNIDLTLRADRLENEQIVSPVRGSCNSRHVWGRRNKNERQAVYF